MTNYTFEQATDTQDKSGNAMMNIPPAKQAQGRTGFLSTAEPDYDYLNNTFIPHDGSYWFQANRQTLQYYLDPRNFLNEIEIFMFEDLTYHPSFQTLSAIKSVLLSDYMKQYANYFDNAGRAANASPVFLAALSRQEVGTSDSNIVINGRAGVLSDGIDYTGYYNFFNIGASSSSNPKLRSLQTAKANGWDSPKKSIVEGATFISRNYIANYQHTLYYQKYNFHPNETKGIWHQYTTNIDSLASQAATTFNSYKSMGVIDMPFKFDIPVFSGMPESTPLPPLGNPNNYMREIKVNNLSLTNFDSANEKYSITIAYTDKVTITGSAIAGTSRVDGLGTFDLTSDKQVQKVIVTSGNGIKKTYEITINRLPNPNQQQNQTNNNNDQNSNNNNNSTDNNQQNGGISITNVINSSSYKVSSEFLSNVTFGSDVNSLINNLRKYSEAVSITVKNSNNNVKTSGVIVTGDKVTISTGNEEKTYTIVVYGDTNGDGSISAIDLLNVQKIIINKSNLGGAYYRAADTNKDGKISAIDLLNVQKHILGKLIISQN
jgi:beta-N-acetylglucosaminidase